MTTKQIEEIAFEEFKNVGDEGLFPNHSDKDIWVNGFKEGYEYAVKNSKILYREPGAGIDVNEFIKELHTV